MGATRYAFKDTGKPVPTEQEVAARLGPEFIAAVEKKMAAMARSTEPQEVAQLGTNVQGMYYAAVLFDRLDACLGKAYLQVVLKHTTERLEALGVAQLILTPHDLKAQVH